MIFWLAVLVAVTIVAILAIAWSKPDSFRIERSIAVAAAPDALFPFIADFRNWTRWSPWEGIDPDLKRTYDGAESGVGAVYEWSGNKKVGSGRMRITRADPGMISLDLSFFAPMKAENKTDIALRPEAGGTRVVWAMHGPQPFMSKLFGVFMNFDRLVGKDFEKGLANLKSLAEQGKLA